MKPYFYACRKGDDLFIMSREAADVGDFLLILDWDMEELGEGKVHRGVLEAARWVIGECRKLIDECPGQIVTSGHSLGGAISAMITAILVLEEHRENVTAVCLGSLPIFSSELVPKVKSFITTFVYGDDIIARLTSQCVANFVKFFIPPDEACMPGVRICMQGMCGQLVQGIMMQNRDTSYDPEVFRRLQVQIPRIVEGLVQEASGHENCRFFLPGEVLLMSPSGGGWRIRHFEEQDNNIGCCTLLSGIHDHSIQNYEEALFSLDSLDCS
jgi:hypothetical protein